MTRGFEYLLAGAGLIALLGGCHHEDKATGHGTVSGEILPGSISDAMLPYDAVKSKAPVAPEQVTGPVGNAPGDNAGDAATPDASGADAASAETAASSAAPTPAATN